MKISLSNKGKIRSQKTREKIRIARLGTHHSEESNERNRIKHSGKKFSDETRQKHSFALKKLWENPEYREKTIKSHTGLKRSDEFRQKMREAVIQRVFPRKDTKIEVKIQEALKRLKIEFVAHKPIEKLTSADIFIEPNIVIFADGCYWHGCPICYPDRTKVNTIQNKVLIRDTFVNEFFNRNGKYRILRFWEHDIKDNFEDKVLDKIIFAVSETAS